MLTSLELISTLSSAGNNDLIIPWALLAFAIGFAGLAIIILYGKGKVK